MLEAFIAIFALIYSRIPPKQAICSQRQRLYCNAMFPMMVDNAALPNGPIRGNM